MSKLAIDRTSESQPSPMPSSPGMASMKPPEHSLEAGPKIDDERDKKKAYDPVVDKREEEKDKLKTG